jgi:ABC-2 type transport system ATP-binding protein
MIEIVKCQKSYDGHKVLDIENFTFKAGINSLLGPNGSGKSTLLKSISGIHTFEGKIMINQLKAGSIEAKKILRIAMAEPNYPPNLSGKELLLYLSEVFDFSREKLFQIAEEWKVTNYWSEKFSSYSSGMQKKISLITAFIGESKWILLDEPFILLDKTATNTLLKYIESYADRGVSFLIATHIVHELKSKMEHKIYKMELGRIIHE